MKRPRCHHGDGHLDVAPYAGAWIETATLSLWGKADTVAPYAGAWIETLMQKANEHKLDWSPPTRGRGLKLIGILGRGGRAAVAPYAGAWIETMPMWNQPARP